MIYLDNAATTQILPEVLDAMLPYLQDQYGNPGSKHSVGRRAAEAVKVARRQVAEYINADPKQIIFTSGGSEANNLAIKGSVPYMSRRNKHRIIVSTVEHESVLKAAHEVSDGLFLKPEFYTAFAPVNHFGEVDMSELENLIRPDTGLVSVMYVNNETGATNPVSKIGKMCEGEDILFHTDCVQAAGHKKIDVDRIGCDLLSLSAHKIHAPKGVGALYVRQKKTIEPLINGGRAQEFGRRGGTENVAGIVGFGKACEIAMRNGNFDVGNLTKMKKRFYFNLLKMISRYGLEDIICVNGRLDIGGKILSIRFDGIDAETLILMLDSQGICVSAGSACNSVESKPSHVLLGMGLTPDQARDSIRVSMSMLNTNEEIDKAANIIARSVYALYSGGRNSENKMP